MNNQLHLPRLGEITAFNFSLAALILGSLRWNPAIWINDYPPDIKAAHGPLTPPAKRQATFIAFPFFVIGIGLPLWSALRLKRRNQGQLSFFAVFTHIFSFIVSAWFLDLTVLDWLLFVTITPDFVIIPGTEGMAGYDDYAFHLREHMRAFPFLIIASMALAFVVMLIPTPND